MEKENRATAYRSPYKAFAFLSIQYNRLSFPSCQATTGVLQRFLQKNHKWMSVTDLTWSSQNFFFNHLQCWQSQYFSMRYGLVTAIFALSITQIQAGKKRNMVQRHMMEQAVCLAFLKKGYDRQESSILEWKNRSVGCGENKRLFLLREKVWIVAAVGFRDAESVHCLDRGPVHVFH